MRINELIVEEQTDEGLGAMIGKGVGALARGVGATVGGAVGAWDAAKQGYQAGKAAVSGQGAPAPSVPAASSTAASDAGGTAAPAQGQAPAAGGTAAPAQGQAPAAGGTAAPAQGNTAAPASAELDQLKATLGKLTPDQKKELAGELEKSMNAPADPKQSADATTRGQQNKGFGFNNQTGVAFNSQAEKDAFKAQQAQSGAAERDAQIAATKQANAQTAQADNALVAAVKAAKAKPAFQQTAQDKLTIKQGAEKGIHESKKKKVVAEFKSNFLGISI